MRRALALLCLRPKTKLPSDTSRVQVCVARVLQLTSTLRQSRASAKTYHHNRPLSEKVQSSSMPLDLYAWHSISVLPAGKERAQTLSRMPSPPSSTAVYSTPVLFPAAVLRRTLLRSTRQTAPARTLPAVSALPARLCASWATYSRRA